MIKISFDTKTKNGFKKTMNATDRAINSYINMCGYTMVLLVAVVAYPLTVLVSGVYKLSKRSLGVISKRKKIQ